jgi:hypothetical protein
MQLDSLLQRCAAPTAVHSFVAGVPKTHEPSCTADGIVLKVSCSRMFLVWLRGALLLGMCSRQL